MKMFQLKVTEDELKELIYHHASKLNRLMADELTTDTTERLHQLMKRLHKDGAEIEHEPPNSPASPPAVAGWPSQS